MSELEKIEKKVLEEDSWYNALDDNSKIFVEVLADKVARKTAERIFERLEKESSGCRLDRGIICLIFPLKTIEKLKKEFLGYSGKVGV